MKIWKTVVRGCLVVCMLALVGCGGSSSGGSSVPSLTSLLSGKTTTSPTTWNGSPAVNTTVWNADGTFTKTTALTSSPSTVVGTSSGTWSVNSSGGLVYTTKYASYDTPLNVQNTISSITVTSTGLTLIIDGQPVVFTFIPTTTGFTTAMLAGKTTTKPETWNGSASVNTMKWNANGTWTSTVALTSSPGTVVATGGGTWSVNSSGQLITTKTSASWNDPNLNVQVVSNVTLTTTGFVVTSSSGNTTVFTFI